MIYETINSSKGFYVGDICYVLSDEIYHGVWGADGYRDGKYKANGYEFAVAVTAYGDGCYQDQNGHSYGVDAGVIGVVPLELCTERDINKLNGLGRVVFGQTAEFGCENGYFDVTIDGQSIIIDTGDEPDEDDEEYY